MISLKELSRLGACDVSIRAIDFDKPVGARGLHKGLVPKNWKCTLTPLDSSRPMVSAFREDPDEAFRDAADRYKLLFGKTYRPGEKKPDPMVNGPKPAKAHTPQKTAVPEDDDDDDGSDLI